MSIFDRFKRKPRKQTQVAGDNSSQIQVGGTLDSSVATYVMMNPAAYIDPVEQQEQADKAFDSQVDNEG